jgi:hypothetical protein
MGKVAPHNNVDKTLGHVVQRTALLRRLPLKLVAIIVLPSTHVNPVTSLLYIPAAPPHIEAGIFID